MLTIARSGRSLGATVTGVDLATPLGATEFESILNALGEYGVLCFPDQDLDAKALRDFSSRFGSLEINVANAYQEPGMPEVMILSNMLADGKPIGLSDAGQSWHTDMSYSRLIAFTNVLYGIKIPMRDDRALGATEFCNTQAAYEALPDALKRRLDGMTVLHDFNKFWEKMRNTPGSKRAPLTPAQRQAKPPVSHPIFLVHPITGRRILYANPGYSIRINELPEDESDAMLDYLFRHQTEERFRHAHTWRPRDLLMWDNMGTIHSAAPDYLPDEHRLIKRCQVMADRFFGRP